MQHPPPVQNDADVFSDRQANQPKAKGNGKANMVYEVVSTRASPRKTPSAVHTTGGDAPDDLDGGAGLALVGEGGKGGGVKTP